MSAGKIRVLVAKPGLDGHDVGAKLICRALADAGMEVVYTGLRQSPAAIAKAAVQEQVDAVGLSILSGAHLPLARAVMEQMKQAGAQDTLVIVGGTVPRGDRAALEAMGVAGVFASGSRFDDVVEFVRQKVAR